MLADLLQALQQPLRAFIDPAERVFLPALLSCVLLSWSLMGLGKGTRALRDGLFPKRIWSHASSRADITMLFARSLILTFARVSWLAGHAAGALWVGLTLYEVLGPVEPPEVPRLLVAVVYTVTLFVAWDFSRFALHWALHRFDALWALHQVHHSAEVMTPLTLYRVHPVESLLYDLRGLVTTSLITGIFLYVFRGTAQQLDLLGINAIGLAINFVGGNLRHSHVWLRFGWVERFLLSPAQHQMHHARSGGLHRTNYGTWLSVWDRWAGTWRPAPETPVDDFGVEHANHRSDSVWSMLVLPLIACVRTLVDALFRRRWPAAVAVLLGLLPARALAQPADADADVAPDADAPPDAEPPSDVDAPADADDAPDADAPDADAVPDADADADAPADADADVAPDADADAPDDGDASPGADVALDENAPADAADPEGASTTEPDVAPVESTDAEPAPPAEAEADDGVDFELELGDEPDETDVEASGDAGEGQAEDEGEDGGVVLENISIVGDEAARRRTGGSAFVVDEEEIERKEWDDLHRALRSAPGVYLREEDGYGLRPNIGLRGASSDRSAKVVLMEDGILLGPAPYSAPAAYYFPLMTRMTGVEVFKGPSSVKYGPNTIGGAVNVLTRPIPRENEAYVDAGLGMRRYGKLHAYWGTTYKNFGVLIEGARVQTNGFKELPNFGVGVGSPDTGFEKNDFMVKLRYASDPNKRWYHQFDVKGGYATETSNETYLGLTDDDFAANPYRRYAASELDRFDWWRSQAEVGYFLARGSFFDLNVRAYRHDFDRAWRKFNNMRADDVRNVLAAPDEGQTAVFAGILRGDEDSTNATQSILVGTNDRQFQVNGGQVIAHLRPTFRILEQDIELGARIHHDQIIRDHTEDGYLMSEQRLVRDGTPRVRTTNNRGTTVAGAFHVIDTMRIKWFTLMPGARVEVIGNEFNNRLTATETRGRDTVFLPGIGAHAQATRWLGFLAGVHSGFSPVAPGQPDEVRPERSINYEAGLRVDHRAKPVSAAEFDSRLELIGFLNDYSNMTSVCTFSSGCLDQMIDQQFNAGEVWVYGAEVLATERVDLPKQHFAELGVSYTYTESSFRSSFLSSSPALGNVQRGDELPYVPVHLATINVGGGGKIWGVYPSVSIISDMRDLPGQGPIPQGELIPLHYVVDLSGQVTPTRRTTIYLQARNLTNNQYMVSRRPFGARPGLPLQLMAGFKYHFGGA